MAQTDNSTQIIGQKGMTLDIMRTYPDFVNLYVTHAKMIASLVGEVPDIGSTDSEEKEYLARCTAQRVIPYELTHCDIERRGSNDLVDITFTRSNKYRNIQAFPGWKNGLLTLQTQRPLIGNKSGTIYLDAAEKGNVRTTPFYDALKKMFEEMRGGNWQILEMTIDEVQYHHDLTTLHMTPDFKTGLERLLINSHRPIRENEAYQAWLKEVGTKYTIQTSTM